MGPKGGLVLVTAYFIDSIGPVGENWDLLMKIAEFVHGLDMVWVIGADWNCSPKDLVDSGWLELVGGCIVAAPDSVGTCKTRSGWHSNLDYFVVPIRCVPAFRHAGVIRYAKTSPYSPSQLWLHSHPRQ